MLLPCCINYRMDFAMEKATQFEEVRVDLGNTVPGITSQGIRRYGSNVRHV